MLVADLFEIKLRKRLRNPLGFEKAGQRLVVAAADILLKGIELD